MFIMCRVQYHDSYKFNAKSYHSMQYHFKSIDTWLMGICQSHCPEHSWKRSQFEPGKRSIFAEDQGNETEDQNAEELADEEIGSQINDDKQMHPCSLLNVSCSQKEDHSFPVKKNSNQQAVSSHITSPQSNKCYDTVSSDHFSTTTTAQLLQRNFNNLDECVTWLLTKISMDIESECNDAISDMEEIELHSSHQQTEYSSSSDHYRNTIPKDHSASKTKMESTMQSNTDQDCHCPQCCCVNVNCIHQDSGSVTGNHFDVSQDHDQNDCGNLEYCKENSSSLECFDFMHTGMNCDPFCINQCPNNSDSNHSRSKSRRSVSPSKATKNGKGWWNGLSLCLFCLMLIDCISTLVPAHGRYY